MARSDPQSDPPRVAVEQAHAEAARAASRLSLMGALGFGTALVVGVTFVGGGSLFAPGHGLETILVAGGIGGGIVFTVLALRATRMARECERRLRK